MRFLVFLFLLPFFTSAQEIGDGDFIYTSLEIALENKEYVYRLDLSKNKLTDFPDSIFAFKNLKYLNLSKNKISLIPLNINELKNLEELNFAKNKITHLPHQMGGLSNLRILIIK